MTSKKGRSYKQLKSLLWTKKRIILQLSLITSWLFGNMHNATNLQADARRHIENEKASNTFNRTLDYNLCTEVPPSLRKYREKIFS